MNTNSFRHYINILSESESEEVVEGTMKNIAKIAIPSALVVGITWMADQYDKNSPKVEIGGQQAIIVPEDHGKIPFTAMKLKDKDGNIWKVWQDKRGSTFAYKDEK